MRPRSLEANEIFLGRLVELLSLPAMQKSFHRAGREWRPVKLIEILGLIVVFVIGGGIVLVIVGSRYVGDLTQVEDWNDDL